MGWIPYEERLEEKIKRLREDRDKLAEEIKELLEDEARQNTENLRLYEENVRLAEDNKALAAGVLAKQVEVDKLIEFVKGIAEQSCCQTPGCGIGEDEEPYCDTMIARALLKEIGK